ncbi:hypothetical protein F442_10828 [Phytophthora nicotianae P10297]|uniref:Uncharacterized protein n=1 Tax=Phytophthora nicotianae P10297 TaxID=1317064 RepID=W2Z5D1_PHYNI|nr:hypothetical protein F442_10828 [Phytophthora nicotianae P10297]
MGSSSVAVGDLAFVGPVHASTLAEFRYVRVNRITGDAVCAAVVGPDSDEDDEEEISISMETPLFNPTVPKSASGRTEWLKDMTRL